MKLNSNIPSFKALVKKSYFTKDTNDTNHPADAAKTTAQKIVLFFAQQKLTEVNNEE